MYIQKMPKILIIDGQGGRIGSQLIEALRERIKDAEITADGTNSNATANMQKTLNLLWMLTARIMNLL